MASTGADAIATGCPGCILQLEEKGLGEGDSPPVRHIAEVMDRLLNPVED